MAKNITIAGADYPNVPSITVTITGGGYASFVDTSDATATASDIASGKTAYAGGELVTGTASGGGGSSTKYGVSIDSYLGDIDSDGVLQAPSDDANLVCNATAIGVNALDYRFYQNDRVKTVSFPAVETIGNSGLSYAFRGCAELASVDLSSLTSVNNSGLYQAFYACLGLTSVDLSSLASVDSYGMYYTFQSCSRLISVDLSSLASVGQYGMYSAFRYCSNLTSVDMSSLASVGQYGLREAFYQCRGLTGSVSFPSLTTDGVSITGTTHGTNPFYRCFYQCTGITELHFPSAFAGKSSYLTKQVLFGGTSTRYCNANLQILFDL